MTTPDTQADIAAIRWYIQVWFWITLIMSVVSFMTGVWGTLATRATIKQGYTGT